MSVRCAAWPGLNLILQGEPARRTGWFARAADDRRHAAREGQELAVRGDRMATYGGFYEQGEIHRLRGDFDAAEACYLQAEETGFPAQPGLALLRLAQGRPDQAQSLLRQAMDSLDAAYRRRMLGAPGGD